MTNHPERSVHATRDSHRDVDSRIFPNAHAVLDVLLRRIDAASPGLVTDVHIIGSIALGDARSDRSDIDLVLIRDDGADNAATMDVLAPVLADLRTTHQQPMLDGIVLSAGDLVAGPDRIDGPRPVIFGSVPELGEGGSTRNPVTWQTLVQCGIAWRGTPPGRDAIWHDPARLDDWTRGNLNAYWRPWLAQNERLERVMDFARPR